MASQTQIDERNLKVGYEIPFTRYFYKFQRRSSDEIMAETLELEKEASRQLARFWDNEGMKIAGWNGWGDTEDWEIVPTKRFFRNIKTSGW